MRINQTLHGYRNGHELLATSREISTEASRLLLILSDMSGPSMQYGFEEYITAYPIKDLNSYAIGKTWYAPEMKRPGCVWTHTLIIPFADLALIPNPFDILDNLKKPEDLNDLSFYKNPINLKFTSGPSPLVIGIDEELKLIEELIFLLYEKSKNPIIIQAEHSKIYERLIFNLWFQQWPRLRRNFSFCTGAIMPRVFQKQVLDLQVVPRKNKIDTVIEGSKIHILHSEDSFDRKYGDNWIRFLTQDLIQPTNFRDFARIYGADVSPTRNAFKNITEFYLFYERESDQTLELFVTKLATLFPRKSEATSIKKLILGSYEFSNSRFKNNFQEIDILFILSTTLFYSAFDYEKLQFHDRFILLYKYHWNKCYYLLVRMIESELNIYGEAILRVLAQETDKNEIECHIYQNKNLALVFESINPRYCYKKEFWEQNNNHHREIVGVLLLNSDIIDWQIIINILIEVDSNIDLEYLESFKINVTNFILNYINTTENSLLNYKWLSYLKGHPKEVIYWLQLNRDFSKTVLRLVLSQLNPNSFDIITLDINIWLDLLEKYKEESNQPFYKELSAFSLALALNIPTKKSLLLIQKSFETVYSSLSRDELSDTHWKHLETHTKPLKFWKEWDKCKKLLNAVVDSFITNKWSSIDLKSLADNEELSTRLINKYKKMITK